MSNTVIFFRNANKHFSYAYIFIAIFLMLVNALPLINFDDVLGLLSAFLLPSFAVYYATKTAKKALASGFCTACAGIVYQGFSGHYGSIIFAVLAATLSVVVFTRVKFEYGFIVLFIILLSAAIGCGLLYPRLYEMLKLFAGLLKGRGALFGAVNHFYEMAFSDRLGDLFYHKAYGGTSVSASGIVSGAMNINNDKAVAQYLTGKYFVSSFVTVGIFLCLFPKLKGRAQTAFCFISALAVIFGDVRLLSVFLLLYSPFLYVGYLFVIFASYLVPSLLNLSIRFEDNASLFELIKYGNQWLYFFLTGIVLIALSYFITRTALAFFNPQEETYYPRKVRELLSALGGQDNIEKLEDECITVYNPNLINILKVDCDIKQNVITLFQDDMDLLKKYL